MSYEWRYVSNDDLDLEYQYKQEMENCSGHCFDYFGGCEGNCSEYPFSYNDLLIMVLGNEYDYHYHNTSITITRNQLNYEIRDFQFKKKYTRLSDFVDNL